LERIVFSLIAFSAFTSVNSVAPALRACFASAFTLENYLWIDFPRRLDGAEEDEREWIRRPLDPISTCLVLTCRAKFATDIPTSFQSEEAVQRGALRVARLAAQQAKLPIETPKTLSRLCQVFIPYWRFRLPGVLAAWCEGRLVSVSMARLDFIRAMTGQQPVDQGEPADIGKLKISDTTLPDHKPLSFYQGTETHATHRADLDHSASGFGCWRQGGEPLRVQDPEGRGGA
jgi:hypothetical protein